ncbi:C40 family peptidase [Leadbetterella sp. DM7]|uniref:C40 family peptidase n=1 Tax=Leadbetterella sp. DM7 TaxID=3235085 RepID=UPI00349E4B23
MRKILLILLLPLLFSSCRKTPAVNRNALLTDVSLRYKGTPYQYGDNTSQGMDCSGLVFRTFAELGRPFPRSSYEQAEIFPPVKKADIQPGDLVYFKIGKTSRINHTGIVTRIVSKEVVLFVHSSSSAGVREDNLYSNYWKPKFVKATRPKI